jgi:carbamoyl-phosphate synthase / aspartate carbamoyltransferase / dihydroorotase
MILPGLIDPHVHLREPGGEYKEDWWSGTQAALAGGFTAVLAMPNTSPPVCDESSLDLVLKSASEKAVCDYAQYLGAGADNIDSLRRIVEKSAGLKMYLNQTFGTLRLDDMSLWMAHFRSMSKWSQQMPIVVHAERQTMAAVIFLAQLFDKPIHIAHVSLKEEILLVKLAKEKGIKVTCEVTPHHLFLTENDIPHIGIGKSEVRPRLATHEDQKALWENLDIIDCFATDHAPHTLEEKESDQAPPGFPGLETALPLFLTAISEGRLSLEDLTARMLVNPRRIFHLPEQPETFIEIDMDTIYEVKGSDLLTRSAWSPFEGWKVKGRVSRVVLRGKEAFRDGKIMVSPGFGKNLRLFH